MKKINIAIENPCHENWDQMTPETQGRFCSSCEKIVIDFSEMSDSEILQFFNKPKTEKICGRFKTEQLTHQSESTQPQKNWQPSTHQSASNPQPPLYYQQFKFQSHSNPKSPQHGQLPTIHPTINPQPPLQLLHFAYILVLVLGIGVSSCNSKTTKGEILMGDTTAVLDTTRKETNQIKNIKMGESVIIPVTKNRVNDIKKVDEKSRIMGKPKIQRVEKVEPKIMGECVMPYEYDNQDESQ